MKNVRLFAVAAALGMFASTVAAAETTKTVTWSGDDEVIRVEIGDTVIAPTVTAKVVLSGETAECNGTDANKDGIIDKDAYMMPVDVNAAQGWMFTDAKYWPSVKTAMYYIGLPGGTSVTGGRFLAPGAAENEGFYTAQLSNNKLEDSAAAYDYLEENGAITTYVDADGDVTGILVGSYVEKVSGVAQYKVEAFVEPTSLRKSLEVAKEDVVAYLVEGKDFDLSSRYYDVKYYETAYATADNGTTLTYTVATSSDSSLTVAAKDIVLVTKDRKGNYSYVGKTTASSKKSLVADSAVFATASDISEITFGKDTYAVAYNGGTKLFKAEDIKYLHLASDSAFDKTHDTVDAGKKATAIAYDSGKKIVSLSDDDLYYVKDGKYVKVNTLDPEDWTSTVLGESFRYGDVVITSPTFLTDAEYAYVDGTNGYTEVKSSSRDYDCWTLDGKAFVEDFSGEVTVLKTKAAPYNRITSLGADDKITFVEVERDFVYGTYFNADGTIKTLPEGTNDYTDASRVYSVTPAKAAKGDLITTNVFNWDEMVFESKSTASTTLTDDTDKATVVPTGENSKGHTLGLYFVNAPANDSDYYVLLTYSNDYKAGVKLADWSYSSRKEEGYYELGDETLTTKAVELDGKWYPAFETEEELIDFVGKITKIGKLAGSSAKKDADTDFGKWYKEASDDIKAGIVEVSEDLPTAATYNLHGAKACDYSVSSEADGSKVTVTVGTVDTSTAGVKDLVYTAKYDGEEVGTTSVKVVVAPKYVRTWEGGRVKTLTSYYVSNPEAKYAEYNYDWANGTVSITYYNVDGSVAGNSTNPLK